MAKYSAADLIWRIIQIRYSIILLWFAILKARPISFLKKIIFFKKLLNVDLNDFRGIYFGPGSNPLVYFISEVSESKEDSFVFRYVDRQKVQLIRHRLYFKFNSLAPEVRRWTRFLSLRSAHRWSAQCGSVGRIRTDWALNFARRLKI